MKHYKNTSKPGTQGWAAAVPEGMPFVYRTHEMVRHPAFRHLNTASAEILAFLEDEHMQEDGLKNGKLLAPYRQLEQRGIARNRIKPGFVDLIRRRLVIREEPPDGDRYHRSAPALYRVTYLPFQNDKGWQKPTDDWRNYKPATPKSPRQAANES
jgi:hypothetical protein